MANELLALDSNQLGRLVHPRQNGEVSDWLDGVLAGGATVFIPEITNYELRRALLFSGLTRSLEKLDDWKSRDPFGSRLFIALYSPLIERYVRNVLRS